jgi:hypothetical protein
MEPTAALDKREIKRACQSGAQIHPDVITNKDSPPDKRPRPTGSPKINWACCTEASGMDKRTRRRVRVQTWVVQETDTRPASTQRGLQFQSTGSNKAPRTERPCPNTANEVADDDKKYDAGGDLFVSFFRSSTAPPVPPPTRKEPVVAASFAISLNFELTTVTRWEQATVKTTMRS